MNFVDSLISIIIPVYNRAEIFRRSLQSALNQTYKDIEIIIVDDGSEPAISIPENLNKSNIQLFRQENKGAPATRNFGFAHSKGEFVIFWDADLLAEPEMLEKMRATLKNNPVASYAYSDFYFGIRKMPAGPFDPARLKEMNYITTGSLIRRADFPGFDESLQKFQDWDLWLTMLENKKIGVYLPEFLFRLVPDGTMSAWLPSFCYRAPWKWLPGIHGLVRKYEQALAIIRKKHRVKYEPI